MWEKAKHRVFEVLEKAAPNDRVSKCADIFLVGLILLNILVMSLETVEAINVVAAPIFHLIDIVSLVVFTAEYILRLWACTTDPKYRHALVGRVRFAVTPLALADLAAILPFLIQILPDIRFARLLRLLRLLKIGRYSKSMQTLIDVFRLKKHELSFAISLEMVLILIASTLMYFIENEAQSEAFSSIPAAMWWGVNTLTTIGYGDVYPITPLGKILAMVISILGIAMFALPVGIIGSGFVEALQVRNAGPAVCPHCGLPINESGATAHGSVSVTAGS